MIEGLRASEAVAGLSLDDISTFCLMTNPRWLAVCDIKQPRTGLEVKFSYNWLAGMTLRGDNTGDDRLFNDGTAMDAELWRFAQRMNVSGDDNLTDLQVRGRVSLKDGHTIPIYFDLAEPLVPSVLGQRLRHKSFTVIGAASAAVWDLQPCLKQLGARDIAAVLLAADSEDETVKG